MVYVKIIVLPFIIWGDMKLFKLFYRGIFTDSDDFKKSLGYAFKPDIISLIKGEYFKDRFAEMKLGFFIFLCVATIIGEAIVFNAI